jgi:hypothetical protein
MSKGQPDKAGLFIFNIAIKVKYLSGTAKR